MSGAETWPLGPHRVVEASAGSGKTFTITTLVCRLVAEEGVPISRILVSTYTNATAAELRERVVERMRALLRELEGGAARDPLAKAWRERGAALDELRARLQSAVRDFDEATITTIHGFCQGVLRELPFESGSDAGRTLSGDGEALLQGATADAWACLGEDDLEVIDAREAVEVAREACAHSRLPLVPTAHEVQGARAELRSALEDLRGVIPRPGGALVAMLNKGRNSTKALARMVAWVEGQAGEQDRAPTVQDWLECVADCCTGSTLTKAVNKAHAAQIEVFESLEARLRAAGEAIERAYDGVQAAARVRVATTARASASARKARERVMTFDDLLQDVHAALHSPQGEALAKELRARYSVALVDEFQDTDREQCEIFERIFVAPEAAGAAEAHATAGARTAPEARLTVVGDPKQSIYLFRGADMGAYLRATTPPRFRGERSGLDSNYRTDRALLDAVQAMLEVEPDGPLGGDMGDMPGVRLHRPRAVHEAARLHERTGEPASGLWLHVPAEVCEPADEGGDREPPELDSKEVWHAVATEVRRELCAGLRLQDGDREREVTPGDVAVLVRSNTNALRVQRALRAQGVPASVRTRISVWNSDEAIELARMLEAMASPGSLRARLAAGATRVGGCTASVLRAPESDRAVAFADWVTELRAELDARGPVPCVRRMLDSAPAGGEAPMVRLLAQAGGERAVTNLLHLAELLGGLWRGGVRSADELAAAMASRRGRADVDEVAAHELQQRIETDGSAVQVVTAHSAKGLQWPIVWVATDCAVAKAERAAVALVCDEGDQRVLALGGEALARAREQYAAESAREQIRLLYVALTRAENRCHVVWGRAYREGNGGSATAALLHGRKAASRAEAEVAGKDALSSVDRMRADLQDLCERAQQGGLHGTVRLAPLADWERGRWTPRRAEVELAPARTLQAALPAGARTTSFTGLASGIGAHAGAWDSGGAGRRLRSDDAQAGESAAARADGEAPLLSREALPAGPAYGDLVHRVVEEGIRVLDGEALAALAARVVAADGARVDAAVLASGLRSVARQRLLAGEVRGVDVGAATLAGLVRGRLRTELEYLLPVGARGRPAAMRAVAEAFERGGEIARRYAGVAAAMGGVEFHGHLTGFIDLVCEHEGRWYVLDYKTNALGADLRAFEPERLDEAMIEHHYVLQYHLYTLAVHRWLRARMPGYDYERHMGGAMYLFVRAMGESRPAGAGVFADRPSWAVVQALDSAFEGVSR